MRNLLNHLKQCLQRMLLTTVLLCSMATLSPYAEIRAADVTTDINELKTQNELLQQRSRFTTGGIAMILGIVALLAFLAINGRWTRRLEIKNRQLQRERNVVVAQNKQLAIERDRAEAASKAKTSFIQSMTHEIRTPLNAISGFTQVLTMPGVEMSEAERVDCCQRIQDNTRLLTNIVDDLIFISDIESSAEPPVAKPCIAKYLAEQALDEIRPRIAHDVELKCESTIDDNCTLNSYPNQIHIILAKLLDNAAKFTTQGNITLHVDQQQDMLHFSVSDTGMGIPEDKKEYIFERFTKLDSYAQGAGLGLSIARMTAEHLGGSLTLDNSYQGGSKFDIAIPIKGS